MRCAQAGPVVAVEVLVEDEVVLPRGIRLQALGTSVERATTVGVRQPDSDDAVREVLSNLPEGAFLPRACRVFDLEVVAEERLVDHELADREVVERHPDRAATV